MNSQESLQSQIVRMTNEHSESLAAVKKQVGGDLYFAYLYSVQKYDYEVIVPPLLKCKEKL